MVNRTGFQRQISVIWPNLHPSSPEFLDDRHSDICFVSAGVYEYLNPESKKPRGGAQRQQHMLGQELRDRRYSVSFLVGEYGQPKSQIINDMLVVKGCPERISPFSLPKTILRFWDAMRHVDPSVYYVRGAPRLAIATAVGCKLLRKPFIFCVANDADLKPENLEERYGATIRQLYNWVLQTADTVITQTERQQSLLKSQYRRDSTQIPNGYDLPSQKKLIPHTNRKFILWVGSSDPKQKRPKKYLNIAEQLPESNFVMVSKPTSDVEYHNELQKRAQSIDNLRFVGAVDPDEIHEYYRQAKLLVNTSIYEGFPNTFLESWRFETPIVSLSFDLDGLLGMQKGGIHSGETTKLCEDIQTLISDPKKRQRLGETGRQLVIDQYSLSAAASKYESIIQKY